jgi:hypothetical protein
MATVHRPEPPLGSMKDVALNNLKPRQIQAAAMLAEGSSYIQVMDALNITIKTLQRWLGQPNFREEYIKRTSEGADLLQMLARRSRLRLMGLTDAAVDTITDGLQATTPKGHPDWAARMRAAEMIVKAAGVGYNRGSDSDNERVANAAVLVVSSDDIELARSLKNELASNHRALEHGDYIDAEVVNEPQSEPEPEPEPEPQGEDDDSKDN